MIKALIGFYVLNVTLIINKKTFFFVVDYFALKFDLNAIFPFKKNATKFPKERQSKLFKGSYF